MTIRFEGHTPEVAEDVFIAPTATVLGRVRLGTCSSVWYGSVLRGDVGTIEVGERTNIQDLCVLHITSGIHDTFVGNDVTVGHRVVLHGCHVEDGALIGNGAVVLDGARVCRRAMVGAGALVPPGMMVPEGTLVLGTPAKVVRELGEQELQGLEVSSAHYVDLAARHRRALEEAGA